MLVGSPATGHELCSNIRCTGNWYARTPPVGHSSTSTAANASQYAG
jgi:hypothetical protein